MPAESLEAVAVASSAGWPGYSCVGGLLDDIAVRYVVGMASSTLLRLLCGLDKDGRCNRRSDRLGDGRVVVGSFERRCYLRVGQVYFDCSRC